MDDFIAYGSLFLLTTPIWFPVVAAAYALGRRQFSLKFLFFVVTLEAFILGAIGLWTWWLMQHFFDNFNK